MKKIDIDKVIDFIVNMRKIKLVMLIITIIDILVVVTRDLNALVIGWTTNKDLLITNISLFIVVIVLFLAEYVIEEETAAPLAEVKAKEV